MVQGTRARPKLHILIVDDDELHGRSVKDVLAAHDFPADTATSGTEGLERLQQAADDGSPYEILILDLHIPDLSGLDILQQIKQRGLNLKTIVLSGEQDLATVAPILNLGAYDYLQKPFQVQALVTSVTNAASAYRLEEANKSMQAEAKDNARLYEFLLNASPNLIYMLDAEGKFRFINRQLDGVFDVNYEQLLGRPWQDLFDGHAELIERLGCHIDERRTGHRASVAEEFSFRNEVGVEHDLELSSIGLYEGRNNAATGEFIGTYGIIRDITEARRTREQLRQSQQKFYSLFANSPDAVFISRLGDGTIIEKNPNFLAIQELLGAAAEDADGFLWSVDAPREEFIAGLELNPDHFDWSFERYISGEPRHFEIRARRLFLEDQPCMLATIRDRTHERRAEQDRLRMQEQMQQAMRMEAIGQVAGGIAHDFNNILASIIGYAELVQNSRARLRDEQVDSYLQEVVTAGHRARDLISQMLTFTRAQRGDLQAVHIDQTIGDVSRMLRAAIPQTIVVNTSFGEQLPKVMVDPVQIQQILINLLINARDAISGNGRIDVDVYYDESSATCQTCGEAIPAGNVIISVTDTGHGIPSDILDKVFDMHFSTRAPDKGTGFGLWMIDRLVHEHDGHLSVETTIDVGTTFRIALPPASEQVDRPEPLNIPVPQIAGRIVVVDDEASVANFIGEVLRDKGFPTVVFTDSPQALDYLKDHLDQVALLLTDGSMPLISGHDLVEFVRSIDATLPIIYITAYSQTTDVKSLQKLQVNTYLQKPFSIDALLQAVVEHTGPVPLRDTSDASAATHP